ncbi:matrix-remodeling-associated protein 7 isoform X1 [Sphaeramia orbicularis]|uniref:Matrix-remodeling-associated protein 7-like n=1 Tax=Sphaeramia orbicularis TaxID=375764 RepID=A0A673C285_9TELE|nr:matrix-remodeling-associated protein 7-like isoform X1 [Sphaeramia orbicularis]
MDVTLLLSAIICTLLALVVATSLLNGSAGEFANPRNYFGHRDSSAGGADGSGPRHNGYLPDKRKKKAAVDDWSDLSGSSHDHWDVVKTVLSNEGATENPGSNDKVESKFNNFMKYIPGKSQSHHLQTMMSKEELEEEQRVQQEQLAAIFQLLKDNKETFGEVTEGDMEEQLKLYSI